MSAKLNLKPDYLRKAWASLPIKLGDLFKLEQQKGDYSFWLDVKERAEKRNKLVLQFTSPDIIWCISSTSHPISERSNFTPFTCMKILNAHDEQC